MIRQIVLEVWNHTVRPVVKVKAEIEPVIGHGLNSVR